MAPTAAVTDEQMSILLDPEKEKEWVETLLNVPSEDRGLVPWVLTEQQNRISASAKHLRKMVIVKGRQTRCSTILLARMLRKATTTYGRNYVVITQTDEMTQNFRQFFKDRLQELQEALGEEYSTSPKDGGVDNDKKLRFGKMKSTIYWSSAEQKVGLRGINTAHYVHASEVAHWPEESAKRIMGGLLPASPANGDFIAESTPNGAAGWFYKKAMDSMPLVPMSLWTVCFYPWWLEKNYTIGTYTDVFRDAGIDLEKLRFDFLPSPQEETLMGREGLNLDQMLWRRVMTQQLLTTGQYFAQEYPEDLLSCWLAAGVGFFHDDTFDHMAFLRDRCKAPREKLRELKYRDPVTGSESLRDFQGPNLQVWEPPIPGQKYVGFQDVSAGASLDGDYSALSMHEVRTLRQVAVLRFRATPGRVGRAASAVGQFYNTAFIGVERNSYGVGALEAMQEDHYPNLYYDMVNQPQRPELGWYTTPASRELMLMRFREKIFNDSVPIVDQMTVLEMGAFTWREVNGRGGNITWRAEAEHGNDDLVIAVAGATTIAPYAPGAVKSMSASAAREGGAYGQEPVYTVNGNGVVVPNGQANASMPWLR